MEATARRLCRYFYDDLATGDGERACALVRCYKTHRFSGLPNDLKQYATRALRSVDATAPVSNAMRCLTLIGTVGDESTWNERQLSSGHQAIPLPSPQIVERAPMIAQLISQFGLELSDVVRPTADVMQRLEGRTYGVFHVEEAAGSPYIPAQAQFVDRYNIRSVVGFGGSLITGDLFAIILFTRTLVSSEIAERFRTVALDVKGCLMPFTGRRVFDPPGSAHRGAPTA